ncbi:MAG: DNA-binding NtrC family response regulator [Planctomycetota bacterium]|jgi:DNA-binding NtrC family response regulator
MADDQDADGQTPRESRDETAKNPDLAAPEGAFPRKADSHLAPSSGAAWRGNSPAAVAFAELLERAAKSDSTLLLEGESGTGKGLASRVLHRVSERADGPFVRADLAALTPSLIEAALFGHERGAFTDAHRARQGLFRQADGGTLVLDDIDLLRPEIQGKLLRVLQEREVEPLGGDRPIPIDVRVVATTNRDLRQEVEEGRFRLDLYYRLAVLTLELPPLRARVGDIEQLAEHLLLVVAKRAAVETRPLGPGALDRLKSHPWPGNVREFENALERVLVLGDSGPIQPGEFDFLLEELAGVVEDIARRALAQGSTIDSMALAMMRIALEEERGNVSAAARRVGLTRRAFDYRMARGDGSTEVSTDGASSADGSEGADRSREDD